MFAINNYRTRASITPIWCAARKFFNTRNERDPYEQKKGEMNMKKNHVLLALAGTIGMSLVAMGL
ncbi:MAG: hypothetical protein K6F32_05675, partial [Bacilli bacterium]|nr:hypothetical protein [Bacilli bacterium]